MSSPFIMSRKQLEHLYSSVLRASGLKEGDHQTVIDGLYPLSTKDAQQELCTRGLAATDAEMRSFCLQKENGVRLIGHTYVWSKEAIDYLADVLECKDKITFQAMQRRDSKVCVADCLESMVPQFETALQERLHTDGILAN